MPSLYEGELQHTEEMQDIITAPPSWLLRWGISVFFTVLLLIVVLSSIIRYPDVIKTQLIVKSNNPPMSISSSIQGRVSEVFVKENQVVKRGEILASFESDGDVADIISLLTEINKKRFELIKNGTVSMDFLGDSFQLKLGELESKYQDFYLSYLTYKVSVSGKSKDDDKVIIEKLKFIHSIDVFISEINNWRTKYLLTSSIDGKVLFASILEKGGMVTVNQSIFYVEPIHSSFFGVAWVSQNNIGKVRVGQSVLIKLKSYPFEEFGMLNGKIKSISEVLDKRNVFSSQIEITEAKKSIINGIELKNGLEADAEIITEEVSVFKRISRSLIKMFK